MKNIRLFTKWLSALMLIWILISLQSAWGQAVNGKVTLKIQHKDMSVAEAQQHIQQKTPVLLTVSMILHGEWVDYLDKGIPVKLNSCQFAYGVTTTSGTTRADAPFDHNPNVWMLATTPESGSKCTTSSGQTLDINDIYPNYSYPGYYSNPNFNKTGCPTYGYGCEFSNSLMPMSHAMYDQYRRKGTDENGQPYYEIDLFPIAFYLKDLATVYVRGVDVDGSMITDPDDAETRDGSASTGATQINMMNGGNTNFTKGDGTGGDWTYGSSACYGGIIPGGIFIEQVPELTQFERSFMV